MSAHPTPQAGNLVRQYAEFERTRGGLLYLLQAGLLALQSLVLPRLKPGIWAPLGLLPLYFLYFALRWPIWLGVYRTKGHVELVGEVRKARRDMWLTPALLAAAAVLSWLIRRSAPSSGMSDALLWPTVAWNLAFWAILLLGGRLGADYPFSLAHSLILWRPLGWVNQVHQGVTTARYFAIFLAAVGLWEHSRFRSVAASLGMSMPKHGEEPPS